MNTDKLLVVFGSSVRQNNPRDIDVVYEGVFGDEETRLVRAWAQKRGLPTDLPIDAKTIRPWRGLDGLRCPELQLPTTLAIHDWSNHVILRGNAIVTHHRSYALPARIRGARSVADLLQTLGDPSCARDGRMAVLVDSEGATELRSEWDAYVQGRLALRNAIDKCSFWDAAELVDSRVKLIRIFSLTGVDPSVASEIVKGGQGGGGEAGVNWVRLDGIQLSYGRLIPWTEALPKGIMSALG